MSVISPIRVQTPQPGEGLLIKSLPCEASVFVGAVVRINESTGEVMNAQANNTLNSRGVIGICQSKSTATLCTVRTGGVSPDLYSSLQLNEIYFLSESTPGQITTTPPTSPGGIVLHVLFPITNTRAVINIKDPIRRANNT